LERFPDNFLKLGLLVFPLAKEFINIGGKVVYFKERLE
jgi:hypothetical protein